MRSVVAGWVENSAVNPDCERNGLAIIRWDWETSAGSGVSGSAWHPDRRGRRWLTGGISSDLGMLLFLAAFQMLTIPVAAHIVGRAVYREKQVSLSHLVDDLSEPPENVAGTLPGVLTAEEQFDSAAARVKIIYYRSSIYNSYDTGPG
jgi:hypothetical protein